MWNIIDRSAGNENAKLLIERSNDGIEEVLMFEVYNDALLHINKNNMERTNYTIVKEEYAQKYINALRSNDFSAWMW